MTEGPSTDGDAALPQDLVQVLALALFDSAQNEEARQTELAALELALSRRLHAEAPGRDHAAAQLLAGLRVDHRDTGVEQAGLAEHAPPAHARPLRDHAAAPDQAVVLDDH